MRFAFCDQKLMTKGIRIRASPALNSSQIGVIPRDTTVSYIEEVENADGVWLRLTDEACAMYCDTQLHSQVWYPWKRFIIISVEEGRRE